MTINRKVSRIELANKVRSLRSNGVEFRYLRLSCGDVDVSWRIGKGHRTYMADRKVAS